MDNFDKWFFVIVTSIALVVFLAFCIYIGIEFTHLAEGQIL